MNDKPVRITIFSIPWHLPAVRGAIENLCRKIGFDDKAIGGVILSVDEALTNIIRHAYGGAADKTIEIELTPLGGAKSPAGLGIRIRDYGRTVDPRRIRSRDLRDVRPGGLGVHIITECMDEVKYEPAEGGGTVLTMVKALAAAREKVNE